MFEGLLQPMHLLVILAVALLVFGPKSLPAIGKGLGESIREFKKALSGEDKESTDRSELAKDEKKNSQ
jgi:sec-independent protein translocase protein TatA